LSTEEEQIEALKHFWSEYGTMIVIVVAIGLSGYIGWNFWQNSRFNHAAEASEIYQQIIGVAEIAEADPLPEELAEELLTLNEQLRTAYDDTPYPRYSALFLARLHVEANELDKAEAELSWILDNPKLGMFASMEEALLMTARIRLARVVLAQGDPQRALDILHAVNSTDFDSTYAEVEGDAFLALGQTDLARASYQRALDDGSSSALIELKLNNISR
jgi:predicted negative regulator of RcsB-dependent stress response